jgi:alanine racemase
MAYIELNKNNFFHNLDYFSRLVNNQDKLAIALKDNAYGHGLIQIAKLCDEYGIKHVFVKNDYEARQLENFNFESILVLYGRNTIKYNKNKYIAISSIKQLKNIKKKSNIEIKIDTGMHRNGILPNELKKAFLIIKDNKLKLKGVFTHFSSADEDSDKIFQQEEIFKNIINNIKNEYKKKFRIHCANSSASHKIDNSIYDIARIGIGAYGYLDLKEYENKLKPVLKLIAEKISTRIISKNDTVGYGSKAFINKKNKLCISNYDIGYGDGFLRLNENKKYTLDNGKVILGRVSMDSLSIEGKKNKIILFSNAKELAKIHDTITYEILTQLSPFLERKVIEE